MFEFKSSVSQRLVSDGQMGTIKLLPYFADVIILLSKIGILNGIMESIFESTGLPKHELLMPTKYLDLT